MPDKKVCLKAVMTIRDGKRVWSGEYACSVCDARFRPDANDPGRLTGDFSKHQEEHHPAEGN
jgi:hypothetical protein